MKEREEQIRLELKELLLPNMGSRFVDPAIEKILEIIKREIDNDNKSK